MDRILQIKIKDQALSLLAIRQQQSKQCQQEVMETVNAKVLWVTSQVAKSSTVARIMETVATHVTSSLALMELFGMMISSAVITLVIFLAPDVGQETTRTTDTTRIKITRTMAITTQITRPQPVVKIANRPLPDQLRLQLLARLKQQLQINRRRQLLTKLSQQLLLRHKLHHPLHNLKAQQQENHLLQMEVAIVKDFMETQMTA